MTMITMGRLSDIQAVVATLRDGSDMDFYAPMMPIMWEWIEWGKSQEGIAVRLNALGSKHKSGNRWHQMHVQKVLEHFEDRRLENTALRSLAEAREYRAILAEIEERTERIVANAKERNNSKHEHDA